MSTPVETDLTYDDLQRFPDDGLRRELLGGELFVTPAPAVRHQMAVLAIGAALLAYAREHAGTALVAPTDVLLSDRDVVEPDVLYVAAEHAGRVEERFVRGAPYLVVEVSSPTTRRTDLTRKCELYERYGVPEYWFVDLDADRVEVHVLEDGSYGPPRIISGGEVLRSPTLSGFEAPVDELTASDAERA